MVFDKQTKAELIKKFQTHESDTASPQVQVALISARLKHLNEHFKDHKKDHHSRRGLMKLVGRRRRLLDYLHEKDAPAYKTLIEQLGIRK